MEDLSLRKTACNEKQLFHISSILTLSIYQPICVYTFTCQEGTEDRTRLFQEVNRER